MTDSFSKQAAPCGAWPSPISAAVVAAGAAPLSQVLIDGADIYWLAGRASEGDSRSRTGGDCGQPRNDLDPHGPASRGVFQRVVE